MFDSIINFLTIPNRFERYVKKEEDVNGILDRTQKRFVLRKKSTTLKVIIPPWGNKEYYITRLLINRLTKKGFSCLSYSFPREILSANADLEEKKFNALKEKVLKDIEYLRRQYGFTEIDLIGVSLGGVGAFLIANNSVYFKDLFFVVPGSCLASCLWDGLRTQKLADSYKDQGIDKHELIKMWHNFAPENNIDNLKAKRIFVMISESDKVIPYCYGKKLSEKLTARYKNVFVEKNRYLGHYLTVAKYFLFSDILYK